MRGYYIARLAGERLRRVYEIAPHRVQQYLEAEILHVLSRLRPGGLVLELGCGYGRVAFRVVDASRRVIGIDTSLESLALAWRACASAPVPAAHTCRFLPMDAAALGFREACFDTVVCVQNGISAFRVDQGQLLREAVRVTRPGGRVLFSSYADRFWPHRLAWFERQAAEGLVGEIDYRHTGDGLIVCRDGFRAGTVTPSDFRQLCADVGFHPKITEVDGSSVFCEIERGTEP